MATSTLGPEFAELSLEKLEKEESDSPAGWISTNASDPLQASSKSSIARSSRVVPAHVLAKWKSVSKAAVLFERKEYGDFDVTGIAAERALRHTYHPDTDTWTKNMVLIKLEAAPFQEGRMRYAFRMKKFSNWLTTSWRTASNFVAKCYKQETPENRKDYFHEVKLQMHAKTWSEKFNLQNPPKKIDFIVAFLVELIDRPGSPLFFVEKFIQGRFEKYNSNSGFVDDEHQRITPHAFSHFTFEASNHQLMVVDIQGVDDLYTDPVIHSCVGNVDFGDGDLHLRGVSLFFLSHECNAVCRLLGLKPFSLFQGNAESDAEAKPVHLDAATVVRPTKLSKSSSFSIPKLETQSSGAVDAALHFTLAKMNEQEDEHTGQPKNAAAAIFHLMLAAEQGNRPAQCLLAFSLLDSSPEEAFKWATKAAYPAGYPEMAIEVAQRCRNGVGVSVSEVRAARWYRRALKLDHTLCAQTREADCGGAAEVSGEAWYRLGLAYENGSAGPRPNPSKAIACYEAAIEAADGFHQFATKRLTKLSMCMGDSEEGDGDDTISLHDSEDEAD